MCIEWIYVKITCISSSKMRTIFFMILNCFCSFPFPRARPSLCRPIREKSIKWLKLTTKDTHFLSCFKANLYLHMGGPKDGGALNCKRNSINFSFKNWKKIKIINKFLFILSKENMQKTLKNDVNRLNVKAALNSGPLQQIQISLGQLFACFATFSMKRSIKNIKTNLWKTAKSLGQRPRIYCRGPELSADLFWAFFLKSFLHFSPMVASNW